MSNMKHLVVMAEDFGFGPTSIAISILADLRRIWPNRFSCTFIGDGVAAELARKSGEFDECERADITDAQSVWAVLDKLADVDHLLSVVAPLGAIHALKRGIAVSYVDPLFWFFDRIDPRLEGVRNYFVQSFSEIERDKQRLGFSGPQIRETGWILPQRSSIRRLKMEIPRFCVSPEERSLFEKILAGELPFVLINAGGVDNLFCRNSDYPELIRQLVVPAIQRHRPDHPIVFIGGGEWIGTQGRLKNREFEETRTWFGSVPQAWSWYLMGAAEKSFISCGLSNLSESMCQKADAFGLPAQNYSQHLQQLRIREWDPGWHSFDYSDFDSRLRLPPFLPEEDGVHRIRECVAELKANPSMKDEMLKRVEAYLASGHRSVMGMSPFSRRGTDGAREIARALKNELECGPASSSAGPGPGVPAVGLDEMLFKSMYKCDWNEFRRQLEGTEIIPAGGPDSGLDDSGRALWLIDRGPGKGRGARGIVTGGPCICFSEGDPNSISLQDVFDILLPIAAAASWNWDLVFIHTSFESNLQSGNGQGSPYHYRFLELGGFVRRTVSHFGRLLGLREDKILFLDTSDDGPSFRLDYLAEGFKRSNGIGPLQNLYQFRKADPADLIYPWSQVYLRNVMMYTPDFIGAMVGRVPEGLAVVENTTQIKAVRTGFRHARSEGFTGFLGHFTYLATPGLSGLEMARSPRSKQILLGDDPETIRKKASMRMPGAVRRYCQNLLPPFVRERLGIDARLDFASQVIELFSGIKTALDGNPESRGLRPKHESTRTWA